MPYLGVGRLALAIITFSFVVYLIPGMWGAPLKGLSGYLPPLHTQDFVVGQGGSAAASGEPGMLLTADGKNPSTATSCTCRTDSKDSSTCRRPKHTPRKSTSRCSSTSRATAA